MAKSTKTVKPGPSAPAVTLHRVSKGKRPKFFDDEALDQLFAIVTALTAELSVAFDRIDSLERVLIADGVLAADRLESYRPDAVAGEMRKAAREQLIQRAFAVFETYGMAKSR